MRDRIYLVMFLVLAGFLLFLGRDLLRESLVIAWGLTFAGTSTVAVLSVALYRFRIALKASRNKLALQEAELSFARKVQLALFPRRLPSEGGLEFSAVCLPAKGISGDYYDVLQLSDGRIIFAIADISGKGISAAILMSNIQALLRAVAATAQSPGEVCRRLNHHLHQVTDASRFATLFYGEWDPEERRLRYVNAGHNPPFLVGSRPGLHLNHGGVPLGILPDPEFESGEIRLEPGDLLVLYSDGITEAGMLNGEEFGLERLQAVVEKSRNLNLDEIRSRILAAVRSWAGAEPEDDMTLVLVRATGGAPQPGSE